MITASFYIAACTLKNRTLVRLRRLREPRYLFGAVVGAAYLYFAIFARGGGAAVRNGPGRRGGPATMASILPVAGTSLAGLVVFVVAAVAWLLPMRPGLLEFSDAETELLFPAPVSRRQLLTHRIVRSQVGSLLASAVIAIFAVPFSAAGRLRVAIGVWVLLVVVRLYGAAIVLTRAGLRSTRAWARRGAWAVIAAFVGAVGVVAAGTAPALAGVSLASTDFWVRLARATSAGATHVVLLPFIALLRPPLASTATSFVPAVGWALVVLACVTAWLLAGAVVLDTVIDERAQYRVERAEAKTATPRVRATGWTLALSGRPELALLWKGAMETIRGTSAAAWRYALPAFAGVFGIAFAAMAANGLRGPAAGVSVVSLIVAGVAVVFGPQMMRSDLRSDFEHLDLLKTWPLRAADVIRGEMAWPVLAVSAVAWAGLLVSAWFSGTALPEVPGVSRWAYACAAALAAPALIAAQFVVHNAATVLFPAWVQLGKQRTRGIDAMGQRLIMLAAIVVALLMFALPGTVAGGVIWLILRGVMGEVVFVPAAVAFAAVVLLEVLVVTELLGPAYERIDVTSVERAE